PESVAAFSQWVRTHPKGLVLDIGSSLGIYSAIALFNNNTVEVIAFDSDLASLAAVRRLCQHATGSRLRLVYGFVTQTASDLTSLDAAARNAYERVVGAGERILRTRYVCLTDVGSSSVPRHRLDDLFAGIVADGRPVLIKCDVEGAELLVLSGGENMLRRW